MIDTDSIGQTDPTAYESLEPAAVWRLFAGIAAVPRPSGNEAPIRAHIRRVAEECGLSVREDSIGNLLIEVPASAGREHAPVTVLQGHLDMVCEKNADTAHDFDRQGIRLIVDTDSESGQRIVRGEGTTLGADNGIGVAMALAAACSPEVIHGPLELLFTIDEEVGMTGAKALKPDFFRGRRMLNLDSEEDDAIYIGCAGGCDSTLRWSFQADRPGPGLEAVRVWVEGLSGGHSGGDIHRNRINAIKLMGRVLRGTHCDTLHLALLTGGSKRNAIPREATATVGGPPGTREALQAVAERVCAEARRESPDDDPVIRVEGADSAPPDALFSIADTRRLLAALAALPHGVLGMHTSVEGLVETSSNVATVATQADAAAGSIEVVLGTLSRSSSASHMASTIEQIASIGRLAGAEVSTANDYPGWEPNVASPLLATCRDVYQRLFGTEPRVTAIHAGLECGIIGERIGGMDMVSIGPHITGAHSPDERVYVASVGKAWDYLRAVLEGLAV